MAAQQTLIVLDDPPLEWDGWARAVFDRIGCIAVDNDNIAAAMAKDETMRKALLENAADPIAAAERLAPHYRRALEQLHGSERRLGLYGTAWLVYAPVDACVIDWSEVERRATAEGVPEPDGNYFRRQSRDFIHARTAKYLGEGRLLELEPGLPEGARIERAVAFLQQLGLG